MVRAENLAHVPTTRMAALEATGAAKFLMSVASNPDLVRRTNILQKTIREQKGKL